MESYLLSKDIYRPIGTNPPAGEPPYPQLTLGWMLLSRKRAAVTANQPAQRQEFTHSTSQLESLRSHWRSAWGKKAAQEFRARLNLWRDFLNDYRQHPEADYNRYAYEVSRRVLLELLEPEADGLEAADREMLSGLDGLLHSVFQAGGFVWESALEGAFPRQPYWYLYGGVAKGITR